MPFIPANLIKSAETLERRAYRIVAVYGLVSGIVGAAALAAIGPGRSGGTARMVGFAIGALIGVAIGEGRAFEIRLRAQTIMCLVSIEANSRRI